MGKTSNASKQKWNKENYTQVKVAVPHNIAVAFKEKCKAGGVSMAKELSCFMSSQSLQAPMKKDTSIAIATRPQRRKALISLVQQLADILEEEMGYMSRIPINLQESSRYESAEATVSILEEALDLLNEAY